MNDNIFTNIRDCNNAMKGVMLLSSLDVAPRTLSFFNIDAYAIDDAYEDVLNIGMALAHNENNVKNQDLKNKELDSESDIFEVLNDEEKNDTYADDVELCHRMIAGIDGHRILAFPMDSDLTTALLRYYDCNFKELPNHIRAGVLYQNYFYFVTGIGYATLDAELLGGTGDSTHYDAFLKGIKYKDIH